MKIAYLFSIILAAFILVVLTGCAGSASSRRVTESTLYSGVSKGEILNSVAQECSKLAMSGSNRIPGWKLSPPVRTYDKKTIFDYIDGAAELYFVYDFRGVAAAEYQNGETSIIVDVYDMTAPESAFGMYSLNRYPEANYVNIGNEGILTGNVLDFWKGRYLCKVYSFDMSEKYQSHVVNFGNILALEIKEAGAEPPLLGNLPQSSLIPRTAKYFIRKLGMDNINYISEENLFNLNAETNGVIAEYQINNDRFELFIIKYPSPEAARSAFEAYSNYLDKKGELISTGEIIHGKSKMVRIDDKFTFVKVENTILSGFWDVETRESVEVIWRELTR